MHIGGAPSVPRAARLPTAVRRSTPRTSYSIDFTADSAEDPLSDGGIWTNNTQGTGGNAAMTTQTSMRVALSADASVMIAQGVAAATINYEDSIAWVPGFSGNQRATATVYKEAGYAPANSHEVQLYLGAICYASDNKRAVELLIDASGATYIVLHDGAPNGFLVITSSSTSAPVNGDVLVGELNRSAKTIVFKRNGSTLLSIDWNTTGGAIDSTVQAKLNALGDGIGLAHLRRDLGGSPATVAGKFGFRNFTAESF